MVKVRLTSPMSSPAKSFEVGEVWEVSPEVAERMVAADVAVIHSDNEPENPENRTKAKKEKR